MQSAWLYEVLRPHVSEMVVVGVRQSRGSKSDKLDAYARAEELRTVQQCHDRAWIPLWGHARADSAA